MQDPFRERKALNHTIQHIAGSAAPEMQHFAPQERAIAAPTAPILVLAGPGSGKTYCIIRRIEHLIRTHGAQPGKICAITFTNKAAEELRHRLGILGTTICEQLKLGTLHSLCAEMLRTHPRRVGLPARFGIADDAYQKLVLSRLGVESQYRRKYLLCFSLYRLLEKPLYPDREVIFKSYAHELRSNNLIDYDEILTLTRILLESNPEILASYQERWDHILVDEFQDLDPVQYEILKLLAQRHRSFFAVGDDDQSIFAWRGAHSGVMKRFLTDFQIDEPHLLNVNCRCSSNIFDAAKKVVPPSDILFSKDITTSREGGEPVQIEEFHNEYEEAQWLVKELRTDAAVAGLKWGSYGLLYRQHVIGSHLEETFIAAGIPCRLAKGHSLNDDFAIARILAGLRIVQDPESDLHVQALALKVLPSDVLTLLSKDHEGLYADRLRSLAERGGPEGKTCWRFLHQLGNLRALRRTSGDLSTLIRAIVELGIGSESNSLEAILPHLKDPAQDGEIRGLAEALRRTRELGGTVYLPVEGGLEIAVKYLVKRVFPDLAVAYLEEPVMPGDRDLVLAIACPVIAHSRAITATIPAGRLGIVMVFKALQYMEAAKYRKNFRDYVAFDLETTGKDINVCAIVEIAAVKVRDGKPVERFHSLVYTEQLIPSSATEIHGYTNEHLQGQPRLEEVWQLFREFIGDDLLVAHNGFRYDVPLLKRATAELGGTENLHFYDTLVLARSLFPASSGALKDLAEHFGVPTGRSHHALDDCDCLVGVFEALQDERLKRSRMTCLSHLLDGVILGAAIEERPTSNPEEKAILSAARWRELKHHSRLVDFYTEESTKRPAQCLPLDALIARIADHDRWPGWRETEHLPEEAESLDRLERLVERLGNLDREEAISRLLDRVALSTSEGVELHGERVNLLTLHATKGLEFDRVYVVGVEDFVIPGYYACQENDEEEFREARRLLYVGMTRARDRLTITSCRMRGGKPSGGRKLLEDAGLVSKIVQTSDTLVSTSCGDS